MVAAPKNAIAALSADVLVVGSVEPVATSAVPEEASVPAVPAEPDESATSAVDVSVAGDVPMAEPA